MAEQARRYRAFISYSQVDKAHARRLHAALEAYRVPKGMVGEKATKLGRFFRDDDEMGAATDLGASLRGAIEDSESLIVICSPAAAQSKWVNTEILHFKRTGRADRIFAVIASGAPHASERGDRVRECFPPALRFEVDTAGELTQVPAEPLAVHLASEPRPRVLARLSAGLLRISFDELWQRDRRRARAQFAARVAGVSGAIVLFASALGVLAFNQARTASVAQSQALSLAAQTAFEAGHHDRALRLAILASRTGWIARASPEADVVLAGIAAGSRRYVEFQAHDRLALSVAYSPDGRWIASGGTDGALRIWDAVTLQQIGRDLQHGSWVHSLAFSPEGDEIATASDEGVTLWDVASGQLRKLISLDPRPMSVAYSPDGARLLAGLTTENYLIDRASGRVIARPSGRELRFSPDGWTIVGASSGDDFAIRTWQGNSGAASAPLAISLNADPRALASYDQRIAVATRDGDVTIWDARTGQRAAPSLPHRDAMAADTASEVHLAFRPDGEMLATAISSIAQQAAIVRVWDAKTGEQIGAPVQARGSVAAMAFSPGGVQLALALSSGEVQVLRARSPSLDGIRLRIPELGDTWSREIRALAFTRDARLLLVSQSGGSVTVLDGTTGEIAHEQIAASAFAHAAQADIVATRSQDEISIWDVADGLSRRSRIPESARAIALSPDGARLALATDTEIQLVDLAESRVTARAPTSLAVRELGFAPTGQILSVVGYRGNYEDRALLLDARTLQPVAADLEWSTGRLVFSPSGDQVMLGRGPSVFTAQSGWRAGPTFEADSDTRGAGSSEAGVFSPDGALLATSGIQSWPSVWDARTGALVTNLPSGDLMTGDVAFSADGTRVFVTSMPVIAAGGTTRIWDVRTRTIVGRPFRHRETPRAFALSPDASRLVVGEQDGAAVMWDVSLASAHGDALIDKVCDERLNALPAASGGSSSIRLISERDARALPSLRSMIGADVCRRPSLLEEIQGAITLIFSGAPRRPAQQDAAPAASSR